MKAKSNNLVGAKVIIDWPIRWNKEYGWREGECDRLKAEAAKNESHFGQTGEIVAYNPGVDSGKELEVMTDAGMIVRVHTGAVTITKAATAEADRTNVLLEKILETLIEIQIVAQSHDQRTRG